MDLENFDIAKPKLRKFIISAQISNLKEFNVTLTILENWSKYILNNFDCHYSNSFIEGSNNKIKVIKRNGYVFRNFKNRILLSMT